MVDQQKVQQGDWKMTARSVLGVGPLLGSVGMSAAFSLLLFCGCGRSSTSGGFGIGCSSDRISCLRFQTNVLSLTLTP